MAIMVGYGDTTVPGQAQEILRRLVPFRWRSKTGKKQTIAKNFGVKTKKGEICTVLAGKFHWE